jgi:TRAP-type C4-dicarboxylate transport system substrate-binding protein
MLQDVGVLPFASKDANNLFKAMVELMKKGYFNIEEPYKKVKMLAPGCTSQYGLLFRKHKPETVADMAGLKCRTPGGYQSKIVAALGMTPVSVSPPEVYTSLERGVIDIHMHHFAGFTAYKTAEIARAILDLRHTAYSGVILIMNLDAWNSLPSDLQQIIQEVAYDVSFTQAYIKGEENTREYCKKHNLEIYKLPPAELEKAKKLSNVVWEQFITDTEAKGLPGKKMVAEFVQILRDLGEDPPYRP